MSIYQSTLRTLSITFDGAKEAVMAVAERVARRVERTIESKYTILGGQLFEATLT